VNILFERLLGSTFLLSELIGIKLFLSLMSLCQLQDALRPFYGVVWDGYGLL
jgi:hypothetical protein